MKSRSNINIAVRLMRWPLLVSILAASLGSLFVVSLIRLTPDQIRSLVIAIAGLFALFFIAARLHLAPRERRIQGYWRQAQAGGRLPDPEAVRDIYACVVNHPKFILFQGTVVWGLGCLVLALYMWIFQDLRAYDASKILFAGVSAGYLSSMFLFFVVKAVLTPVRDTFRAYHHVEGIADGVHRVSLRTKLLVTFVSLVCLTLTFSAMMFYERTQRALLKADVQMGQPVFDRLLAQLAQLPEEAISEEGLRRLASDAGLEHAAAAFVFDLKGNPVAATGEESLKRFVLDAASQPAENRPSPFPAPISTLASRVPERPWHLAIFFPARLVGQGQADLHQTLFIQLALCLSIAIGLAVLAANDVNQAIGKIGAWSKRVAVGDLRTPPGVEGEDELGELSLSLSDMSRRLGQMILQVRRTTVGVEKMLSDVETVGQAVMNSSEEQTSGVLQATSVFEEMSASIKGIAENTERLSVSAEESSSSILEMGATVEEVSGNMEGLGRSVEESVSSIEEMTAAVREVARNVEGLAEVAEQTSSSMDEMATTIKQVEENALESRRLSEEMVGASRQGSERVSATIAGIEAIRGASEEAQRVITSLGRRAEEIGEIVDVIDEVAEETNLLALNAAIIAAQAGEHGRGFSVVADEIKDLAERVASSTKEIGKLIRAVQDESGNAVGAVQRGSELVAKGERLSQEAGRALEEITTSARKSGEMIGEIAQATAEQSKGSESVVLAMERVREMVIQIRGAMEEQTRGSEQVMGASMSMRDVTQQVRGTIQEQARGSGRITTNIENIRDMVQQINGAIQEQRRGTEQAVMALEHIRDRAERNHDAARQMSSVVQAIVAQADMLKVEIERFETEAAVDEGVPEAAPPPFVERPGRPETPVVADEEDKPSS